MLLDLRELYSYRELLLSWTLRQIKIRYKQTAIGAAWAILQPMALMLIFTVVFTFFVNVPSDGIPYPIFAYVALLPWTLTSNALSFAVPSIVNVEGMVKKIYFPREIIPLAEILASCVDFAVASAVLLGLLVWYQVSLGWTIAFVPILLLIQVTFTTSLALAGAALNVFYRDIRFVVPVALQLWFYASPVIYPLSAVPEWARPYYVLNPLAGIVDGYRRAILTAQAPDFGTLMLAVAVTVALAIASYIFFKKAEARFADVI